jgi:hypothetical protein
LVLKNALLVIHLRMSLHSCRRHPMPPGDADKKTCPHADRLLATAAKL